VPLEVQRPLAAEEFSEFEPVSVPAFWEKFVGATAGCWSDECLS